MVCTAGKYKNQKNRWKGAGLCGKDKRRRYKNNSNPHGGL